MAQPLLLDDSGHKTNRREGKCEMKIIQLVMFLGCAQMTGVCFLFRKELYELFLTPGGGNKFTSLEVYTLSCSII